MKNTFQKASKNFIGRYGEGIAENFLKQNKYKIIKRNFCTRFGEIDIICKDLSNSQIVFVEVKTRLNITFGYPEECVDYYKISKIIKTAEIFIEKSQINDDNYRFDIIAVIIDKFSKKIKIKHIKSIKSETS